MNRYWNIILGGFALLSLLAIYCMAGEMDYQDALTQERITCEMVERGIWPEWQARNLDCKNEQNVVGVRG